MVEVLSTRDPEHLKQDPDFNIIAERLFDVFEREFEAHTSSGRKIDLSLFNEISESSTLQASPEGQFTPYDLENENDRIAYYSASSYYDFLYHACRFMSESLINELMACYNDKFKVCIFQAQVGLKHFYGHYVAVIQSRDTGKFYIVSPANIISHAFQEPGRYVELKYDGKRFDRLTSAIVGDTLDSALDVLKQVEGGNDWRKI